MQHKNDVDSEASNSPQSSANLKQAPVFPQQFTHHGAPCSPPSNSLSRVQRLAHQETVRLGRPPSPALRRRAWVRWYRQARIRHRLPCRCLRVSADRQKCLVLFHLRFASAVSHAAPIAREPCQRTRTSDPRSTTSGAWRRHNTHEGGGGVYIILSAHRVLAQNRRFSSTVMDRIIMSSCGTNPTRRENLRRSCVSERRITSTRNTRAHAHCVSDPLTPLTKISPVMSP